MTGFGLVHALEPLNLPTLALGDSCTLKAGDPVILGGAGGRAHAAAGRVLARAPFAGYWEYLLDDAIITAPAHPHWSGAALIGSAGRTYGRRLAEHGSSRRPTGRPPRSICSSPSELLAPILDDLARGKTSGSARPWLGVFAHDVGAKVVIVDVSPRGPAARAELRSGDIILAVGGVSVSGLADFYTKLWARGPGRCGQSRS